MALMAVPTGRELRPRNGALRLCSYLGEESASIYDPHIGIVYCKKVQSLLVAMVPSISMNPAFFEALRPKSGCLPGKSGFFFHFLNKVVQTLPAVRFQCSINMHKLK